MPSDVVRDAIHGLIKMTPTEWDVINTPAFQRLRNIQQLAMTHLVYPCARHTRFEHSLGACHVAGRLASRLEMNDEDREFVRLAALVHDIGHGPFSHVSEWVLKSHEQLSAAIVRHDERVRKALGDERAERIADLLIQVGEGKKRSLERDVIAGPADADKFDYLLRDSYFCGVAYGRYDLDKIIDSARPALEYADVYALGFSLDAVYALEEMVLARHHMHRQVYGHKTRLATDAMLKKAMMLGVEEEILPKDVFAPVGELNADYVNEYLKWHDAEATSALMTFEDSPPGQLIDALVNRRLYKRVHRFGVDDLTEEFTQHLAGEILVPANLTDDQRRDAERKIAASIGLDEHWVALWWQEFENPVASRVSLKVEDKDILLVDDSGKTRSFARESEIFENEKRASQAYVYVYARPKEEEFTEAEITTLRKSSLEALETIGTASADV